MDKVPTSAAVDEAVKIAKRKDGQQAGNFINAVLRNFMRSERRNEEPKLGKSNILCRNFFWIKWYVSLVGNVQE